LTAAIVIAYGQYIWSLVRQRPYTLEALDSLFAMTLDPTALFNLELLKKGKLALLFGFASW